jgi:hypothetical protein
MFDEQHYKFEELTSARKFSLDCIGAVLSKKLGRFELSNVSLAP